MNDRLDPLILDLVEWIAKEPRAYADVIDIWRTSCPRLTVWEDAVDRGYLSRERMEGQGVMVTATALGLAFLRDHGRVHAPEGNSQARSPATPASVTPRAQ